MNTAVDLISVYQSLKNMAFRHPMAGQAVEQIMKDLEGLQKALVEPGQPKEDAINPQYYQGDYVMRIIEDFKLNFRIGTVVKYCLRADNKGNRKQDLKKAMWYLQREIDKTPDE